MKSTTTTYRRCSLVLLSGLLLIAGCQAAGALIYKAVGEPDVPAQYELAKKPTLVLVENYRHSGIASDDADLLARMIHLKINQRSLVPLVPHERLLEFKADRQQEFAKMTVTEIAQKMQADQVLYVHLQSGGVSSLGGGSILQGKASVLVKVIDAATGDTLWPVEIDEGRTIGAETNPVQGTDRFRPEEIRNNLYNQTAHNVVRLFYKWKPDSSDL